MLLLLATHLHAERGAQRSCKMSSSQCAGSKPQPVLLHCKRSTPADGEENLPAAKAFSPFPSSSSTCTCTGAQPKPVLPLHEVATSSKHSMGWFGTLPAEILHKLFCLLDHQSLGLLSLTSKEMATAVLSYLQSTVGLKRVIPMVSVGHSTSLDPLDFRRVGMHSALFLLVLSPLCA